MNRSERLICLFKFLAALEFQPSLPDTKFLSIEKLLDAHTTPSSAF